MAESRRDNRRIESARLDLPRDTRRLRLPRLEAESFGRWSEAIARFMGTAWFLVYMTVIILLWIGWNTLAPTDLRYDPYTFTFLTLILSLQASYAAPLILLAQNRQADRDRLAMEEDRRRAAMQKADTEFLAREIASLRIALGEVATRDFLRSELNRLAEEYSAELDESARRRKAERKGQRGSQRQRRAARQQDDPTDDVSMDDLADDTDGPEPRRSGAGRPNKRASIASGEEGR